MIHSNANGRRDPWRLKLDALNFRVKAGVPSPLGGRVAADERLHDLQRRFTTVTSSSRRERNLSRADKIIIGIAASWALALALTWFLMGV
jgi:hypothetical protein